MKRVLCIDDEEDFRDTMSEFLECEGYEVFQAMNGREGLDILQKNNTDIILCDVNMPEISGYDFVRQFYNLSPSNQLVPIIFVSAMGQKKDILSGISLTISNYIVKPVDFDIMLATIWSEIKKAEAIKKIKLLKDSGDYDEGHYLKESLVIISRLTNEMLEVINNERINDKSLKYINQISNILDNLKLNDYLKG